MNTRLINYVTHNGIFNFVNEPMSKHTTFHIGGRADMIVYPTRRKELTELIQICKEDGVELAIIGNGSNVIVSDKGIRGLVIMTDRFNRITFREDGTVEAWAGAPLAKVANLAKNYSLTGMEFAYGIPGSVGGAVYMNAGAYNRQMCNIVEETEYMNCDGKLKTIYGDDHKFGYRTSFFKENGGIILRTVMRLTEGNSEEISAKMQEYTSQRAAKQPLDKPSAGSVFKRPEGYFAGKLIEDAGLKGVSVGGAQVSPKHAGFIVNTGVATCKDVLTLIDKIKDEVYKKFGVELQEEIQFIGEK